jgi:hypothetical protein
VLERRAETVREDHRLGSHCGIVTTAAR